MLRSIVVVCAVLGAASPASAAPHVTSIMYALGGVMSGPYRVSADLAGATASEAKTPPNAHGDGAGISTASLPVTGTQSLSPAAVRKLDALASAVWRDGPERKPVTTRHVDKHGRVSLGIDFCQPSLDALGRFEIVRSGMKRTFDFSTVCMTKTADRLLATLTCAANPDNCPKP